MCISGFARGFREIKTIKKEGVMNTFTGGLCMVAIASIVSIAIITTFYLVKEISVELFVVIFMLSLISLLGSIVVVKAYRAEKEKVSTYTAWWLERTNKGFFRYFTITKEENTATMYVDGMIMSKVATGSAMGGFDKLQYPSKAYRGVIDRARVEIGRAWTAKEVKEFYASSLKDQRWKDNFASGNLTWADNFDLKEEPFKAIHDKVINEETNTQF